MKIEIPNPKLSTIRSMAALLLASGIETRGGAYVFKVTGSECSSLFEDPEYEGLNVGLANPACYALSPEERKKYVGTLEKGLICLVLD